ncbi:hypothetical protein Sjap_013219 [Stephania japonica]|uniref:Uncharacterized protein n=1 Tax=Stephania japonica TaxID=461633 RepID=A0AAP0IZG3_9MAGN
MSWWRSAVNKVVEAGGKNSVTRRARNYAEAVVQHAGQAVAEGAKILQDSIGALKIQSYRATVKNLEELSVSCTGNERIQLLRKWLVALVEIERLSGTFLDHKETTHEPLPDSNESKDFSRRLLSVLYSDPDLGVEPMIFRDVFLYSQALEGMTLSMILEAPDEEEVSLLVELFGRCLIGGKEVHKAIICSLQELAKAFSRYQEEILAKKGELLQFAQAAMSGLKLNADIARIDAEASFLWQKLDGTKMHLEPLAGDVEGASQRTSMEVVEALTEAFTEIQLCHKLEVLLLRKKSLNNGDLPDVHSRKVDKLRVLSESLANSTLKAENRASDHRLQKDEALKFRVTKASEVMEVEKELAAEVSELEKQRDELEAQMKEVNTSLAAAYARLKNTREEKVHFDEASAQIIAHLKSKEDELSNSLASYRIEADVVNKSISFLEGTWCFQSLYTEKKDKQTNDELEKYEDYFLKLVTHHLSSYEVELSSLLSSFRTLVEQLLNSHEG